MTRKNKEQNNESNAISYDQNKISTSVDSFTAGLTEYLNYLALPIDAVLVPLAERKKLFQNIPSIINDLSYNQKSRSTYISKFIASCSVGLFDAALNFLWNETISNLRTRIIRFYMEYFYDSVISDPIRRKKFNVETDLNEIEDWELIKGCLATGLISEIAYKHLDFIRDMRNHASAAHPNQNQLTGLQVASWLETCIKEVLSREPTGAAIEIKEFLSNLRQEVFVEGDVEHICASFKELPSDLSQSLLRTMYGMFTDSRIPAEMRNNIMLTAPSLWGCCSEEARTDIGLKVASLSANGEVSKKEFADQFLKLVNGLTYLPINALSIEIQKSLQGLLSAHGALNNFYNEPLYAELLSKLVPLNGQVPDNIEPFYVKTLMMCRIGNGYGISNGALSTHDALISKFGDRQVAVLLKLLRDDVDLNSRMQFQSCANNLLEVLAELYKRVQDVFVQRTVQIALGKDQKGLYHLRSDSQYSDAIGSMYRRKV